MNDPFSSTVSEEDLIKSFNSARNLMNPNQPAELLQDLSLPELMVIVAVKKLVMKDFKGIHFGDIKDELSELKRVFSYFLIIIIY